MKFKVGDKVIWKHYGNNYKGVIINDYYYDKYPIQVLVTSGELKGYKASFKYNGVWACGYKVELFHDILTKVNKLLDL